MSNNSEDFNQLSLQDIFASSQETLADAQKKSNDEKERARSQYFRIAKDGTFPIRILPLAPVIGPDGAVLPMERKGYEYPTREIVLKINTGTKDKNGKDMFKYVNVCDPCLAYRDLETDLISLYSRLACDANADDEELCKKLRSSSFNGGLKYDRKRCMYILNMDERDKGLQIFQLSNAQYKELEERKLILWAKLNKKSGSVPCPISSPFNAYPVEIIRKTEQKTSYSINIDTVAGFEPLTEEELKALLDAPRLPEVLYVYRRFHLEATIAFLNQMDERLGSNIMSDPEIQDCIDQIKMQLPADDTSHFTVKGGSGNDSNDGETTLEELWDEFDAIANSGKDDRSDEGQELRAKLREFIEAHGLDIRVDRKKTNEAVLEEIAAAMDDEPDSKPAPVKNDEEDEDEDEPATPDTLDEDEDEDDGPVRRSRNDDTNEPATRPSRRVSRSSRRR